jgi:transglutaminase-like putative cysteine protease
MGVDSMYSLESLVLGLPEDVERYVMYGDFDSAERLIDIYTKRNIPELLKKRIQYEKRRIRRLTKDYIYSFDVALEMAIKKIKDFSGEELQRMIDERFADWIYINGRVMLHDNFLETIIKVVPNISDRLLEKHEDKETGSTDVLNNVIDDIINNGEKKYFIHVKAGLKLKGDAVRKGETIRVHLPIPKEAQQIKNIKLINTSPKAKFISPEDYPQRTAYFEKQVTGEELFTVEYSYESHIKYNQPDPNMVSEKQPDFYTEEMLPQIRFTPYLVNLAHEIVKDEKNPLIKSRKIYDYVTQNVQYSFMREYASIINIPEYAAYNLKGDCGVMALLFITLCRIVKIPARWQSGLYVNPTHVGNHDWVEFYVAPYGWLFADPSFGGSGYRTGNMKKWNFYFGNLDPFRMVANSDFQQDLMPEKKFFRADPYDNQIGEAEYADRGLYPEDFQSIKEIIDIHEI